MYYCRKGKWQMDTPPSTSKPFTRLTDESAFSRRHFNLLLFQVNVFRPPRSLISDHRPWITAVKTTENYQHIFRHPLTSKPHSLTFPHNSDLYQLHPSIIALSCHLGDSYPVDFLFNSPGSYMSIVNYYNYPRSILLALYGGGQLRGCPCKTPEERRSGSDFSPWVKLSSHLDFDDIVLFRNKIYAVDRGGLAYLIHSYKTRSKFKVSGHLMGGSVMPDLGRFGWRKRFVVHGRKLHLVVRTTEKSFQVYMLMKNGKNPKKGFYWCEAEGSGGNKVLFMARNHYFFLRASRKFPGREYRNCIVFSEAAFPQYGIGCWEFTQSGDRQFSEDDIAVFSLSDGSFAREGENSGFPKIDWSPPAWILNASSFPAAEFQKYTKSESSSSSLSESEPNEDHRLELDDYRRDSGDKSDGEVQSDLKSKEGQQQEEMEFDFVLLDQDQNGVVFDSANQDKEDGNMQFDSNSQEKEDDVEIHSKEVNIEVDASLQEAHVTPSLSAIEDEVTRTLLRMNDAVAEENSGRNITHAIPTASTFSRIESRKSDSPTTKFEGLDIRSDLIQTLEKIWQKHGNVIKDSTMCSGDIVGRALESLATMVRILEDNPAQSLSDDQANYLSSTLSDLKCMRFKVCWLISFVEQALLVHKSKSLVVSLNNLNQISSQGEERRAILLDELAKLDKEQNKVKEEIANVSKMIPFSGLIKVDEPIGAGLT